MHIDLTGKTALVTGSTRGIGHAVAIGLARAGAEVVLNGRQQLDVDQAVSRLLEAVPGGRARGVAADLGSAAGFQTLKAAQPQVDILVNNLGIFGPQPFAQIPDEAWERFFQINVMSGVRASRLYLPGMQHKDWGRIVFISSESALNIPADMIHYGMTKTANLAVSRGLAKSLAGTGITVNAVLPGPTLSEGVHQMVAPGMDAAAARRLADAFVQAHRGSSILRRAATPEEVAHLVVYVCSPQASATTGAALRVDGGVVDTIV